MFDIDDFQPLRIEHKPIFDSHYAIYPPNHSENVFTTLMSWSHFVQPYFLQHGDNLMIMTKPAAQPRFRPPTGPRKPEIFKRVMELAKESGTEYLLVLVDNETRDWISGTFKCMDFVNHRDYYDYVYLASDLAELQGKNYLKMRNKLNKFKRQFSYTAESLCEQNVDEIRKFLQRWCLWKDCESDPLLENERLAVMYTMEHCFELGLCGLAIRINGEIQGVTVFESMSPEMAVIHFEKAMPDFEGLYQVINNESAKLLAQKHKYIDRQSDLGIEGLRTAKERYHPHHMIEVQHLISSCEDVEEEKPVHY